MCIRILSYAKNGAIGGLLTTKGEPQDAALGLLLLVDHEPIVFWTYGL
jgi:hypothetical protein